jgi:nitrogen-specific signal transduction histidine kinase
LNKIELLLQIIQILNHNDSKVNAIKEIAYLIKQYLGIDAIGIRLKEGKDYPYYASYGFSDKFIETENFLLTKEKDNTIKKCINNNFLFDCFCGKVLMEETDILYSCFTENGSFYTGNICKFELEKKQNQDFINRNICCFYGYKTVVLIPLKSDNKIIGLIQLNDKKENAITTENISFFEKLGECIGVAFIKKQYEEEMKSNIEKLESSNEELESFAYTISHDLKEPLRTILNYCKLLTEANKKDFERYNNYIIKAADKMKNLIKDLMEISKVGKIAVIHGFIDINLLVSEIISNFEIDNKNISFIVKELSSVYGDKRSVELVFSNLISNAIKFRRLDVNTAIEIGMKEDGIFYVKDNGIGIDKKYFDRIFVLFKRLHTDEEYSGTGVGLSIVKKIINNYNGKVWLESEIEKGATFFFSFSP